MREQPIARARGQVRRMSWSTVCVLPLCGVFGGAWAQGVPAGLRACTAESDSARRLACYDREMARLKKPPAPVPAALPPKPDVASPATTAPAAQAPTATPVTPQPAARETAATPATPATPAPAATSAPAASSPPAATSAPAAAPAPAAASATSAGHHSPWNIFAGGSRVTARIEHLDRWPNAMVLHLDNGQVWQQIGRATGDLSLQVGDSVTIEKHLGSYWLSAGHVSDMQVRQKSQ